jgi:zinc protease
MSKYWQKTAAVALLLCVALAAAAPDAYARKKPWEKFDYPPLGEIQLPDYERHELDNGLVIYLAEDHDLPLLQLSATIRAGGIYDPPDKVGLGSVTGTVLRTGGTASRTGDEIDELVESMGMFLETYIDDDTGGAFLSCLAEDAGTGLDLLADILRRPAFAPEKIELAKQEETTSISRRNDEPMGIIMREAMKVIYGPDHPLARHPEYDTVNAIAREDLVDFHARYFHPDRTYLVVIGDFDLAEMLGTIESRLGDWPAADAPLPPDPEIPDFPRTVNVIDKDDLNQSTVILGHKGIRADSPHYAGIQVANRILGGGFASRLFVEVRSNRGLAYSVGSQAGTGFRFPGIFGAFTATKSASTQEAAEVILAEIEKMTVEPVSEEELRVAVDGILNSEVFNFDTKREILDRLVLYEMYGYPADFLQRYQDEVRTMTPAKVLAAAQAVWHPEKLSIVALGNREDWDGDLSEFGPVNEIDITIPEPSLALDIPAATPESLARGQELMAKAAAASGGRAIAGLKSYHEEMNLAISIQGMNLEVGVENWVRFPDRKRAVQRTPFGNMTVVLDGDQGWQQGMQGVQALEGEQLADAQQDLRTDSWLLLRDHAQVQCQALEPVEIEGRACLPVYVTGFGDDYQILFLDAETFLPYVIQSPGKAPMTGAPITQKVIVDAYGDHGGLEVAESFRILHDDVLFGEGTLTKFEANPQLEAGLFQEPTP